MFATIAGVFPTSSGTPVLHLSSQPSPMLALLDENEFGSEAGSAPAEEGSFTEPEMRVDVAWMWNPDDEFIPCASCNDSIENGQCYVTCFMNDAYSEFHSRCAASFAATHECTMPLMEKLVSIHACLNPYLRDMVDAMCIDLAEQDKGDRLQLEESQPPCTHDSILDIERNDPSLQESQ